MDNRRKTQIGFRRANSLTSDVAQRLPAGVGRLETFRPDLHILCRSLAYA